MAVKVISGVQMSKPKAAARQQLNMRLLDEDIQRLDECAAAAKTDRTSLIRRLIRLAHAELIYSRELAARSNGHEPQEEK